MSKRHLGAAGTGCQTARRRARIAGVEDYPSLRESIDVAHAFERDGVDDLDEQSLLRYFCYFVKTSEAQEFLKLQLDYLLLTATAFHPQIDVWLLKKDENYSTQTPVSCIGRYMHPSAFDEYPELYDRK